MVIYHLQKVCRKPGCKGNRTRNSGSFQRKISGSNRRSEIFQTGSFFISLKPSLIPVSGLRGKSFFGKWNRFVQMANAIRGRNYISPEFLYHLPKPWTDLFDHVNSKRPVPCFPIQQNFLNYKWKRTQRCWPKTPSIVGCY